MDAFASPTQQLAEFLVAISAVETEAAAAHVAVERAAEALDADVAAIVCGGEPVATVGYPEGAVPVDQLEAVTPGIAHASLDVPGVGSCPAAAAPLEHPRGTTFVLARPDALTREELGLLQGMTRVAAMTMRMLGLLDEERTMRAELGRLAREQAALRHVATLVAKAASPAEIFSAVAEELAQLSGAEIANVLRYETDGTATVVGGWSEPGTHIPVGARLPVTGEGVAASILRTGRPTWARSFAGPSGSLADRFRRAGLQTGAGSPVIVDGRLWGAVIAARAGPHTLPPETEHRLPAFTELVATTIANAQAHLELSAIADEQAALRRVATLVASGAPPRAVFPAVAEEVGRLLRADLTLIGRYAPDGAVTGVAGWGKTGEAVTVGSTVPVGGRNVAALVLETEQPTRMDGHADAFAPAAADARDRGIDSAVGAPIRTEGRVWGVMLAASRRKQPLPLGTEERLAGFTQLVATAIANAEARDELRRVADEQAALRRVATLVARAAPPPEVFAAVAEEIGRVVPADVVILGRYHPDGQVTSVSSWSRGGEILPVGLDVPLGGRNVHTLVFETGCAARIDGYGDDSGAGLAAQTAAPADLRWGVGAPINVAGGLWGVAIAAATRDAPLPVGTEARLAEFTDLVATAIANGEAHAELTASRARVVAAADQTRRRIERDLHDGAQQRLVTLELRLRAAQVAVPPELAELAAELDRVAGGLASAVDELREYARGIHPAILAEGGLGPALRGLSRRCPIPVVLDVRVDTRLPERIEVTAYYVISEALTNAAKHSGASAAHVDVATTADVVRLAVRDDGAGGADPKRGSGLVGLKDRVDAAGGTMVLESRPGEGTSLVVELPITGDPPP